MEEGMAFMLFGDDEDLPRYGEEEDEGGIVSEGEDDEVVNADEPLEGAIEVEEEVVTYRAPAAHAPRAAARKPKAKPKKKAPARKKAARRKKASKKPAKKAGRKAAGSSKKKPKRKKR
jgi:hypothetical protein